MSKSIATIILIIATVFGLEHISGNANTSVDDNHTKNDDPSAGDNANTISLTSRSLINEAAYIPSQCYTKTEDDKGNIHNPCYSCHTTSSRPNYINDFDLQQEYSFPEFARQNHWSNLFVDRTEQINEISDQEILEYIRESNYKDPHGNLLLAEKLTNLPTHWDYRQDGQWDGFVPDAYFHFDKEGFDRSPENHYTGWRAFAYYPFLGTFWPTNGSTDDVLIRLPKAFQTDIRGKFNLNIYKVNLAIVEAAMKEHDIAIDPINEAALGNVDIDKNGHIGTADHVAWDWAPLESRFMQYVGLAGKLQKQGKLHLAAGLYPEGTEFLHSVRYIDVDDSGVNKLAPRMKELRYARKRYWKNYSQLQADALEELKQKDDFPDRLRTVRGNMESGVSNGQGWVYAGFIEDAEGNLRPQTYEEQVFCVGCHGGTGATRDGIYSLHRKVDPSSFQRGWYHWSQKSLQGLPERIRSDGHPEYSFYLQSNGAGDEFRENSEIRTRFFDHQGKLRPDMLSSLQEDVSLLLFASPERALALNKAYRLIVQEQSFTQGRDATLAPTMNVHRKLEEDSSTGVVKPLPGF